MSIETDLSSIAKSLALIADYVTAHSADTRAVVKAVTPVATPKVEAEVVVPKPVAPQVSVPVVSTPTAPVVAPVTPAPVVAPQAADTHGVTDQASLTAFVMAAYKEMGPIKGAKIQDVLTSMGVKNINEVKPEQYGALVAGVNALRG